MTDKYWLMNVNVNVCVLYRHSSCHHVKPQPPVRWSECTGSGFCKRSPLSCMSPRAAARRKMARRNISSLRRTVHTFKYVYTHTQNVRAKTLKCVNAHVLHQSCRPSRLTDTNARPAGGALTRSAAPSAEAVWLKNRTATWRPAFSPLCRCTENTHIDARNLYGPIISNHRAPINTAFGFQVFLTNSANVFLLEPCQDVPKLMENQLEVCKGVLSVYRHIIMEQNMNRQTWSVPFLLSHLLADKFSTVCLRRCWWMALWVMFREQLLQVLLRITEAVMKRPQESQRKDVFAHSLASILFKVSHF